MPHVIDHLPKDEELSLEELANQQELIARKAKFNEMYKGTDMEQTNIITTQPQPNAKASQEIAEKSKEVSKETGIATGAESEYLDWVAKRENNKFQSKETTGWDKDAELWTSHGSREGGNDTLAYGHKLLDEEKESGTVTIGGKEVNYTKGLTDEQARQLLKEDMEVYEGEARKVFEKKHGKGSFDKLEEDAQLLLQDFAYNLGDKGLSKYPKLMQALKDKDWDLVNENYIRKFKNPNTGLWEEMTDRNTATYDMFIKDNVTFK